MTAVIDLVRELQAAGARFEARGETLRIDAPRGLLTTETRETLRAHKAALLSWLTQRDKRAIVTFNLAESPDAWPVVIGAPSETIEDVKTCLQRRYGERLIEVRPYRPGGVT